MNPTPVAPSAPDPWASLETGCAVALAASREVLRRLEDGALPEALVPLLERERDAVDDLRLGIAELARRGATGDGLRRDAVARQLALLMEVDGRSRDLLSRQGVPLTAFRRARPSARRREV